jgi:hypothetical protein
MMKNEPAQVAPVRQGNDDPVEHPPRSWDGTNLPEPGSAGWVPITAYGLRLSALGGELVALPHGAEERRVALADLRGQQASVFAPYVLQLAAESADSFTGDSIVPVFEQDDGAYLTTGHHRTCAALERGDTTMLVKVIGRVLNPTERSPARNAL